MKDCILYIQQKKRGNMDTYNKLLVDMFGEKLSWKEVNQLPKESQMKLMLELGKEIDIANSNISISKLASAIQRSRSGVGGSALTEYECAFCGEKEMWINTTVPKICRKCAKAMATNIVLKKIDILKNC
jgi:hypothetical protein